MAKSAIRASLCILTIVCGLGLRGFGLGVGLPALVVKYGGSMLWATMVFFMVTLAAPNLSRARGARWAATRIALAPARLRQSNRR